MTEMALEDLYALHDRPVLADLERRHLLALVRLAMGTETTPRQVARMEARRR